MISIKFFHNFFLACAAVPPSRPSFQILNAKKSCGKLPANNAQQLPQPFFFFHAKPARLASIGRCPLTADR